METRLLSVCRLISTINPDLKIPDTSVVAVNIDREKLEEIRKCKGLSVKSLKERLGYLAHGTIDGYNMRSTCPSNWLLASRKC